MRNVLLATAALTLIAAPAMAQDHGPVTGSIGYTQLDAGDADLGAITGRLGYDFTPNFGIEGEASVGVRDADVTIAGVDGSIEHEYDAAVYGVAKVPVSPNLELFGRVGYGTTSIKTDVAGFTASEDGESLNYGAGANWFFDSQNGVRADWTRRDFQDDGADEVDTWSLGYVRRF